MENTFFLHEEKITISFKTQSTKANLNAQNFKSIGQNMWIALNDSTQRRIDQKYIQYIRVHGTQVTRLLTILRRITWISKNFCCNDLVQQYTIQKHDLYIKYCVISKSVFIKWILFFSGTGTVFPVGGFVAFCGKFRRKLYQSTSYSTSVVTKI